MGSKHRSINTRIWNDRKFKDLSDDGKLLFFFLLTNPHMTPMGAMRHSKSGMAEELGWSYDRCGSAFQELQDREMVEYDSEAFFLLVPNFIKYNAPQSINHAKAWGKYFDDLPECDLQYRLYHRIVKLLEEYPQQWVEGFVEKARMSLGDTYIDVEHRTENNNSEGENDHNHNETEDKGDTDNNETENETDEQGHNEGNERKDQTKLEKHMKEKYPELYNISYQFHYKQQEQNPTMMKDISESRIVNGADALRKLIEIDKFDLEKEIIPVLNFVIHDDFWNTKVLSLSAIRKESRYNGEKKIVNILSSMKQTQTNPASNREDRYDVVQRWKQKRREDHG